MNEWIEKYMTDAENLIYENKVDEGLNLMKSLLYEEPGYARLHNHLGWAYLYYTSDVKNAELHLKMAIQFESEFMASYLHIGTLFNRTGRHDEALKYLQTGLTKANANKVAFLEAIGVAYETKREYSKAIKVYKEASLASMAGFEMERFKEGIKRCRKKRITLYFSF
jgi:tetratricopeptide (TPR) repeat protein